MLSKLKSKIEHAHFAEQVNRWSYRFGLPGAEFDIKSDKTVLGVETVNDLIIDAIIESKPVLFSRLGSIETETAMIGLHRHSSLKSKMANIYTKGIATNYNPVRRRIKINAGVFPTTDQGLDEFSKIYSDSIQHADYLIDWKFIRNHRRFTELCHFKGELIQGIPMITNDNTWSGYLKGKKVLVIHPFKDTIEKQYQRRESLFSDKKILPDFDLKCIKAVSSNGTQEVLFSTWADALHSMQEEIKKVEFDVAIIGAGAYGLPLGAFIKQDFRKPVIHIGGASQLLFGIKGRRWDHTIFGKDYYNEHWMRPSEQETPKGASLIEGATYW